MTSEVQRNSILETALYAAWTRSMNPRPSRYTAYVLATFASWAISHKINGALPFTAFPACAAVLIAKNKDLFPSKEENTAPLTPRQIIEKTDRLAKHLLVLSVISGIILSGVSLSMMTKGGNALLKGSRLLEILSLFRLKSTSTLETLKLILKQARLMEPLSLVQGVHTLSQVGYLWAPLSLYLLRQGNSGLYNRPARPEPTLDEVVVAPSSPAPKGTPLTRAQRNAVAITPKPAAEYKSSDCLENVLFNLVTAMTINDLNAFRTAVALLGTYNYKSHFPENAHPHFAELERIVDETGKTNLFLAMAHFFMNMEPIKLAICGILEAYLVKDEAVNPQLTALIKEAYAKYNKDPVLSLEPSSSTIGSLSNRALHASLITAETLLPAVLNPLPTLTGFILGWKYPLGRQSKEALLQWTFTPNFADASFTQKSYYLFKKTALILALTNSQRLLSYPTAMLYGFMWSESFQAAYKAYFAKQAPSIRQ